MTTNQLIGFALLVAGCMDVVLALILRQRIPDEGRRRLFTLSLATASGALILLGLFLLSRQAA